MIAMTQAEAREMLRTAQTLKRELEWIAEEYARVTALLHGIAGQAYDRPVVQHGHDGDRRETLMEKRWELESLLLDTATDYVRYRMDTAKTLVGLHHTARDIIRAVYLDDQTIADASEAFGITYGHARNIIADAPRLVAENVGIYGKSDKI